MDSKAKPGWLDPLANLKSLIGIVVIVAVLIGGFWLYVRYFAGQQVANRTTATILRQPIDLKNVTENIPANSSKTFGLTLPYDGTLAVEVTVVNGNGLNIYVVKPDQIDNIKNKKPFTQFHGFGAAKSKSYQRSGRLQRGEYSLVVLDTSFGFLSKKATDVKIHARLEP